jgi:hypothetical protein
MAQQVQAPKVTKTETKITPIEAPQAPKKVEVVKVPEPVLKVAYTPPVQATGQSKSLSEWLLALRTCESGATYTRNTGNGFYGAYQFMPDTWNRIAYKIGRQDLVGVSPDLASPADQDAMIIANTNLSHGLDTQNPGCYRKLGLSNKPPQE